MTRPLCQPFVNPEKRLAAERGLPILATNNVHYAVPERVHLAAAVAAVRANRGLDELDGWLPSHASAHLRSGAEMAQLFARYPAAVPTAAAIGEQCAFDLRLVAPKLPPYDVPPGHDENSHLRQLTLAGADREIIDRHIADKAVQTVRTSDGTEEVDVPAKRALKINPIGRMGQALMSFPLLALP